MKPATYYAKPGRDGRIAVFRRGPGQVTLAGRFRTEAAAQEWIGRQVAEDAETRLGRVRDYLAERAARPPRQPDPDSPAGLEAAGQGRLF